MLLIVILDLYLGYELKFIIKIGCFESNCSQSLQAKKKEIQQSASMDQAFLNKMNINIPLVKEHDHDIKLAKLLATNKQKSIKIFFKLLFLLSYHKLIKMKISFYAEY